MILASNVASACDCRGYSGDIDLDVKQAFVEASSAVVARVESIEQAGVGYEINRFTEIKSWKGTHRFRISTLSGGSNCRAWFELGRTYLLYLLGPDDRGFYTTDICSRSKLLNNKAKADIEVLNEIAPNNSIKVRRFSDYWRSRYKSILSVTRPPGDS